MQQELVVNQSVTDVLITNTISTIQKKNLSDRPEQGTNDEKALFEIECGWLFFEQGHYPLALDQAKKAAGYKKLELSTKLRIKDLHGHCLRKMHTDREVYLFLQKSIKYLKRFPSERFAFSIYINYLEALVSLGFEREAKDLFELRPKFLKKIKDDVLWLRSYVLTRKLEYIFTKNHGEKLQAFLMIEALGELAEFLEIDYLIDYCNKEAEKYSFDIDPSQVFYFQDWTYLKYEQMILFTKTKTISKLDKKENIRKIIDMLLKGPMFEDTFFKRVTNKTYDPELHGKFLDQILSKVRKVVANEYVAHEDRHIFLK